MAKVRLLQLNVLKDELDLLDDDPKYLLIRSTKFTQIPVSLCGNENSPFSKAIRIVEIKSGLHGLYHRVRARLSCCALHIFGGRNFRRNIFGRISYIWEEQGLDVAC